MPEQNFPQGTDRRPFADGDGRGTRSDHQARPQGVTTVRRWSNWSLAALVVGVAWGTSALARTIPSHAASTTTTVVPTAGTTGAAAGTTGAAPASGTTGATTAPGASSAAPSAPKPIAVTSPSGVTTYVMPGTASGTAAGTPAGGVAGTGGTTYVARGDT